MEFPRMMYRVGSMVELESGKYDWRIVQDKAECDAASGDGWHLDQYAAKAATEAPASTPADDSPPTRDELEQKATELGLKFDGRWGDKRLADAIAAKLAEG